MGSFRNRLLVLISGLVILTQTVTLVAVSASTQQAVKSRALEQLTAGTHLAEQLIRVRHGQLGSGLAVLAADYGFREAVALGDSPTMISAARNHAQRIGADLMLVLDTRGLILASTMPSARGTGPSVKRLLDAARSQQDQPHFMALGGHAYQIVLAPIRAPETMGWVVLGFDIDERLAERIGELVGADVTIMTRDASGREHAASTLEPRARADARAYFSVQHQLESSTDRVDLLLHKSTHELLAPYREIRETLLAIGTVALLLAVGIGLLAGRSASQPIAELGQAARRIEAGSYDTPVATRGPRDFRLLASAFNEMQQRVADRERRITHLAYHDALTGLPNRASIEQRLGENLKPGARVALILLDVRNVPDINASLGHHVGDDALREIAVRLQQNAGIGDLVARVAAHQFAYIARQCSIERAALLAAQLVGTIRAGFHISQVSLDLNVVAGIATYPQHADGERELLRRAQSALQDADAARGQIALYRSGRDEQHLRRLEVLTELRRALAQGTLSLAYQPKVRMDTREVKSVEALARWSHPQLGEVPPSEFVPLAEQTGSSRELTSWVIGAAVKQAAEWRQAGLEIDVAVNLSAPDILDASLADEVLRVLRDHGLPPTSLLLEITESAAMREPVLAARNMQLLRVAGVRFAIDDFGTGYSSLAHLSRLPVDELKIDRSLISHIHLREDDATILTSTIELGHNMGLKVVAEGVERAEHWNLLRRMGCDLAQGYLISPPLPHEQVCDFVRRANQLLADSDSTMLQLRALEQLADRRR